MLYEAEARLAKDDTALFKIGNTIMARADGGFGGPRGMGPSPHRPPRREPDLSCDLDTRSDQALLYRLNGDRNPLHADPLLARRVGYPVPILHGLCTYGVACHAILKTICAYDYTLITGFDARFSAPVLPGEVMMDLNMDYESIAGAGSMLGSGAVMVMDETTCMVKTLERITRFYFAESCGQCTPCREGTGWLYRVVKRIDSAA